jgi:tripartite-type tricarboxylate transporter receptor subunit TctC
MERFARNARIELLHIPYRGGGMAVTDLMGDRIDLVALSEIALRPAIDTGKAKLLATLDPTRGFGFPDVPSIAEAGYPSDVYVPRIALFGPPKLRDDVVARWVNLMPDLKANEAFVKGMKETGSELSVVGPTELRLLLETDSHAWQPLITELDLKSE